MSSNPESHFLWPLLLHGVCKPVASERSVVSQSHSSTDHNSQSKSLGAALKCPAHAYIVERIDFLVKGACHNIRHAHVGACCEGPGFLQVAKMPNAHPGPGENLLDFIMQST